MKKETKQDIIGLGYFGAFLLMTLMWTGVIGAMYEGEDMTFETSLTNPVYTVIGNSSNLEGMNISFENNNITIKTNPLMQSDNFTIIFFDEVTREVDKIVYRGGGGSNYGKTSIEYVDRNQTVYVPEYINNTELKWNNNTEYVEVDRTKSYPYWIAIVIVLFVGLVWILSCHLKRMREHEEYLENAENAEQYPEDGPEEDTESDYNETEEQEDE